MDAADVAILCLDLQDDIIVNSRTNAASDVTRTAVVLAKLASLHQMPCFLSSVPPGGPYLFGLLDALGGPAPLPRTRTTAFGDPVLAERLKASGRSTVLLAGVASEIVVQRTALDAIAAGYEVQVAVDACGGISERTEKAAWARITAAGAVLTSVVAFAAEIAGDFTEPLGGQTLGLMYEAMGG